MKQTAISLLLVLALLSCEQKETNTPLKLTTFEDSVSYLIGSNVHRNLYRDSTLKETVKLDMVIRGLNDFEAGKFDISDSTAQQLMMKFQQVLQQKQMQAQIQASSGNKEKGLAFLEENKSKEGVMTTESGIQYEVITEGTGASPSATDKVKVHYHGTHLDGTVFDSSVDRGDPAEFPLNGVIAGWTEGLQLMKEGGKFKFYIPSDLAYGDQGRPGIPAGSTLIFEVELLKVL
ncbi:FKBP-type peptidyl-prolyl cis-trans isomerase [Candidatus Kapabacteria bacterium]|nr:FKBP-type peptidyl-prolyl cis-trans isomerase [Candidatus Kapabacteria bacterium]